MKKLLEQMQDHLDEQALNELFNVCDCICIEADLEDDKTITDIFTSCILQHVAEQTRNNNDCDEDDLLHALFTISELTGTPHELLLIKLVNQWGRSELYKHFKTTRHSGNE